MLFRVSVACLVAYCLSGSGLLVAEEPAAVQPEAEVARLIEQLGSPERAVRQRAARELLDLGPSALRHFPAPELLPTAGVRTAVAQIRTSLERRLAQESVLPSRITLKDTRSLRGIVQDVARQTDNPFDLSALSAATLLQRWPIEADQKPFWELLDELSAKADLRYDFQAATAKIRLRPASVDDLPELAVQRVGAFRLSIPSVKWGEVSGKEELLRLRLNLGIAPEPRLRTLFLQYAPADLKLTAGADRVLPPLNPDANYELALGEGGRYLQVPLDYLVPKESPPTEVSLSGRVVLQTAAGHEQIRFLDLPRSEGVARRRGGVTVKLARVQYKQTPDTPDQQDVTLRVHIVYDVGGKPFESHKTWIYHNEVYLETAQGTPLPQTAFETALEEDGAVAVDYHFQSVPGRLADYSFIYIAPTLILDVPVEFNFARIPLPAP